VEGRFRTTHWSVVLAARTGQSTESRSALAKLCEAYWYPLYAFVRRQGYSAEEACDLTQGYFARLIERDDLRQVDPERGRFRSFLLASIKHFLANERDREKAKKRSPGQPVLSLDAEAAEGKFRIEPADGLTPETLYEKKWAMTVLERALERLGEEWSGGESQRRFETLRGQLAGDTEISSHREAAEALGMTEEAVKVTVDRMRRRFAELLREEIAHTVRDPSDVDEEIRHLLDVLGA
jgi:RNA polymerase sigma factor (sigma-70 family)